MPFQLLPRPLPTLASALAAAGLLLALAGCGQVTPLGPGPAPASLPPPHDLGSPIIVQIMRSQPPTPAGRCPARSIALFGSQPNVPRAAIVRVRSGQASPGSTPTPPATPPATPVGVACYLPAGRPVTITSAAVSSVTTFRYQPGSAYGFVVAFPTSEVAALTAIARQAYESGDATGISVAGKLWQAAQPQHAPIALRADQITLLSRNQAFELHRLLVP